MSQPPLHGVAADLRDRAEEFRRYGAGDQAEALEAAADDVEQALREWWTEPLSAEQAARAMDVTRQTVYRKMDRGELPELGGPGRKVRRCDLPCYGDLDLPDPSEPDDHVTRSLSSQRKGEPGAETAP